MQKLSRIEKMNAFTLKYDLQRVLCFCRIADDPIVFLQQPFCRLRIAPLDLADDADHSGAELFYDYKYCKPKIRK